MIRRLTVALGVAGFATLLAAGPATAQPVEHGGLSHEGKSDEQHGHEHAACTAQSSDEECYEFWESHINWWSTDYKKSPTQAAEHRHMPPPLGFALFNFVVFAGIMYRLAGRPLREFVQARHITIKKDLDEAATLRRAAEARMKEYEARLAGLDAEIAGLVAGLRKDAEAEKSRIIASAEKEAARIRVDAERQIQTEMGQLKRELRREVVEVALAAAEKILQGNLRADDQRHLVDKYLTAIESAPAPAATPRT
jgi:F-type H+-transporting ATPase subunit b